MSSPNLIALADVKMEDTGIVIYSYFRYFVPRLQWLLNGGAGFLKMQV
jgi:hypothetical protein